jgi:hypothetical protein
MPFATPGLKIPADSGRVSQAHAAHGERIRRLAGKRINTLFGVKTRP